MRDSADVSATFVIPFDSAQLRDSMPPSAAILRHGEALRCRHPSHFEICAEPIHGRVVVTGTALHLIIEERSFVADILRQKPAYFYRLVRTPRDTYAPDSVAVHYLR